MEKMAPRVKLHGQLSQNQLADLLQKSKLFVLPSFYEGLPLVVVEAIACGCRVVCTDLPGVRIQLEPALGEAMTIVDLPQMKTVDQPMEDALPEYVDRLCSAIEQGLSDSQLKTAANLVESFTWNGVFKKVEDVWVQALSTKSN
jgi:glycosyltransferase involved in cell wall biosynthesis